MCFPSASIPRKPLAVVFFIYLSGCATHRAYFGHASTDLGALRHGSERAVAEKVIGTPERVERGEQSYTAYYLYDRGYVGRIEAQDMATKLGYAPIMAWGELLTLGILGVSLDHCQEVCQKGQLEARYDPSDRLVTIKGVELADAHPMLDGCLYNAGRSMISFCMAIRDMVRPSTLPPSSNPTSQ